MQHLMKKISQIFSRYECWLIVFAALAALPLFAGDAAVSEEKSSVHYSQNNTVLAAQPCEEDNDAAFRWDSFHRATHATRVDSRVGGRLQNPGVPQHDEIAFSQNCVEVLVQNCLQRYYEIHHCYYHKIWRRVLPTRAGPFHA
jgi:hypothetical protein